MFLKEEYISLLSEIFFVPAPLSLSLASSLALVAGNTAALSVTVMQSFLQGMAESLRNTTGYTLSGHITETLKPHIIFVNFVWRSPSSGQTLINTHWKKVQDKGLGAPCREKPLEKSRLEPAAPNRPADRKHCALSTHPNPHPHTLVCLFAYLKNISERRIY